MLCYSVLVIETEFGAVASNLRTTEAVVRSTGPTISVADAEIAALIKKDFDVTLAPVDAGNGEIDGFWKGEARAMDKVSTVWVTRLKQVIRIG